MFIFSCHFCSWCSFCWCVHAPVGMSVQVWLSVKDISQSLDGQVENMITDWVRSHKHTDQNQSFIEHTPFFSSLVMLAYAYTHFEIVVINLWVFFSMNGDLNNSWPKPYNFLGTHQTESVCFPSARWRRCWPKNKQTPKQNRLLQKISHALERAWIEKWKERCVFPCASPFCHLRTVCVFVSQ